MFVCKDCGYTSVSWIGKCPTCGSYNIVEKSLPKSSSGKILSKTDVVFNDVKSLLRNKQADKQSFISTGFSEVDNVFNYIHNSGVYLLGGEPGIGKSTLAMQILGNVAEKTKNNVLYVTAEESEHQVSLRAKRIISEAVLKDIDIVATNDLISVLESLKEKGQNYKLIVFDSMQAFQIQDNSGVAGGISQVRDVVYAIVQFAKSFGIPVIIIGQITKQGIIAGPKLAEHIVDVVAYLENMGSNNLRVLRVIKNRFGEVGNIGFLKLKENGFVDAPTAYSEWITSDLVTAPGSGMGVVIHGTRPLLIQVQSLIVDTKFTNPKRVAEGFSRAKLELLIAVANKYVPGINLSFKDVFVKLIGSIKIKNSCIDLAILASLISGYNNKSFGKLAFVGEVGLLGDIKPCSMLKVYKKEAEKFGFDLIYKNKKLTKVQDLLTLLSRFS